MSEEKNEDRPSDDDAAKGERNEPRGNPETDQDAVDKGIDQLERVKAY